MCHVDIQRLMMAGQGEPEPPSIKEEEEDVWTGHDVEQESNMSSFPLTVVLVKSEDDVEARPSQLLHSPSEGKKSSRGLQGERGGEPSEGSQPDSVAPLSDMDDVMSHSSDDITAHSDDGRGPPEENSQSKKHFSCSECGKAFGDRGILNQKPFNCSVCVQTFRHPQNLLSHLRYMIAHKRMHAGEKPFACSVCAKKFSSKGNMMTHMRGHTGEKPFTCTFCDKGFTIKGDLMRHRRTHTGEKPFSCHVCDKRFTRKCHVNKHKFKVLKICVQPIFLNVSLLPQRSQPTCCSTRTDLRHFFKLYILEKKM
uniref:C2H2-type domain-containing protein n=1 Tax=Hippocampus comes TaxID=109280 RepID=A0A3Q2XQE2_HIPCM